MQITVHSLQSCPHCQRVLSYLSENGIQHESLDYSDKASELSELKKKTGHPTVPQVFFDGVLVGGADDFFKKVEAGALA